MIYKSFIKQVFISEGFYIGNINYIFLKDDDLLKINIKHLNHNTFTDIITFDYSDKKSKHITADIYISVERILENSKKFNVDFENELIRVMSHGLLHCFGYNDNCKEKASLMREKEEEMINLFHKIRNVQ